MRNQQRQSATLGEEINIKLDHNTSTHQHVNTTRPRLNNKGNKSSQYFWSKFSGAGSGYCFIVFGRTGTGKIGKFCLKLNFYQV